MNYYRKKKTSSTYSIKDINQTKKKEKKLSILKKIILILISLF